MMIDPLIRHQRNRQVFNIIGSSYEQVFGRPEVVERGCRWIAERVSRGSSVLDIGCGTGTPAAEALVAEGFAVTGIDSSEEMIRVAAATIDARFIRMDMRDMAFADNRFDAAIAFNSLLFLSKAECASVIGRVRQVLRRRAPFVMSMVEGNVDCEQIPILFQWHGDGQWSEMANVNLFVSRYSERELHRVLTSSGFSIECSTRSEFVTPSGDSVESHVCLCCRAA